MSERRPGIRREERVALIVVSLGTLMVVIDGIAIGLTLPLIKKEFGLSQQDLVWVVNAFLVTYAGFQLLGGRLGDLFGHRRVFLCGLALFGVTSLYCGLAGSWGQLIGGRLLQGLAGTIIQTVALPLLLNVLPKPEDRPIAMGMYGFVINSGATVGLLLSGTLTSLLGWRSIFLLNVPITAVVYILCKALLPRGPENSENQPLDLAGAITITGSLSLAVLGIIQAGDLGWGSRQALTSVSSALALTAAFIVIQARSSAPLIPMRIFRMPSLMIYSVISALFSAALASGIFASFYVQLVLGYTQLHASLVFAPSTVIMAAFSLHLSARLVTRFGIKRPLVVSILVVALGLALLVRVPVHGSFGLDVFPGLLLFNLGAGAAGSPLFVGATRGVQTGDIGLVSGVLGTAALMGATLGLALLSSVATAHSRRLVTSGVAPSLALTDGYHAAFLFGAVIAVVAAVFVVALPSSNTPAGSVAGRR